jgi:hypothetical protein
MTKAAAAGANRAARDQASQRDADLLRAHDQALIAAVGGSAHDDVGRRRDAAVGEPDAEDREDEDPDHGSDGGDEFRQSDADHGEEQEPDGAQSVREVPGGCTRDRRAEEHRSGQQPDSRAGDAEIRTDQRGDGCERERRVRPHHQRAAAESDGGDGTPPTTEKRGAGGIHPLHTSTGILRR